MLLSQARTPTAITTSAPSLTSTFCPSGGRMILRRPITSQGSFLVMTPQPIRRQGSVTMGQRVAAITWSRWMPKTMANNILIFNFIFIMR